MTEGTRSYLFGCHHFFFHPLWVLMAWRRHFGRWPLGWQITCIFLHDIGICGRNYLSNDMAKDGHWKLGADLAFKLFGPKGRSFCAGHTPESESEGYQKSDLFIADKGSWLVAPMWWLQWNHWAEGFRKYGIVSPREWREIVRKNLMQEQPYGNHELDLKFRAKSADVCKKREQK